MDTNGFGWITLTTDYGLADAFVAACHGVIARRSPGVQVIDVTHLVPPGDVRRGATVLAEAVPHLPVAVHVAVVDPGVGTPRRGVAVETGNGVLVGPDNGLLMDAADALGGARRAVHLTNADWHVATVSATFHGRDVFAPVAARIATGADPAGAGTEIDVASLVRLPPPRVHVGDGFVEADVVAVDHFGNVQLAASADALADVPRGHPVTVAGLGGVRGTTFADASPGRLVAYGDSAGRIALAINGGRAASALSVEPGDAIRITLA